MLGAIKKRALFAIVLMVLGFSFGAVYVFASGAHGETVTLRGKCVIVGEELPTFTSDERAMLEKQALNLTLSDPRVKDLIDGKQYNATSHIYLAGHMTLSQENGEYIINFEWDGKISAEVTIIFTDKSGYFVEVNLTDQKVEDIRYAPYIYSQ